MLAISGQHMPRRPQDVGLCGEVRLSSQTKNSSEQGRRRLPHPSFGIGVNFCRNPQCGLFGIPPNPYDGRGKSTSRVNSNQPHGSVGGSGDLKFYKCPDCKRTNVLKNNRAIVEEYKRLRRRFRPALPSDACPKDLCENHDRPISQNSGAYGLYGKTTTGAQRWRCKGCGCVFTLGSRIRRQKRSSANRDVLWGITNGLPISKISSLTGLSPRDVYAKIDFIYERVADFTARREAAFETVDWEDVGRRFATDSQTLHLNWPNKRTRAQIDVQHLCSAHANTGYIMAAHLALDPSVEIDLVEQAMIANGDFEVIRAFRKQARVWSKSEFKEYVDRTTIAKSLKDTKEKDRILAEIKEAAGEVKEGLQVPHRGGLIRQDILQLSHAFVLRHFLGKGDQRFIFVVDSDPGLSIAFLSAFSGRIRSGKADVVVVSFNKTLTNDQRNGLVSDGKVALERATGITREDWALLDRKTALELTDEAIRKDLLGVPMGQSFMWPFHTKSEPYRQATILTDRSTMPPERRARLMRLATLRSVDSYFHKVRSNLRFASRPAHTPSNNMRAWDRHYLYKPETMVKIIEIYRFVHNWMGHHKSKESPAMKMGLAKGKIRESELFG